MPTIEDFYAGSGPSIELFNAFVEKHGLLDTACPDHICYKCASKESFEYLRTMLESNSHYIHQSIISKRRIAYIKLQKHIDTDLGPISFVELSDQKPDGSQIEGFDRIEVYPTSLSYELFVQKLAESETVLEVVRPHHTTHDIDIGDGFIFRCTEGPLIEKIKSSEM